MEKVKVIYKGRISQPGLNNFDKSIFISNFENILNSTIQGDSVNFEYYPMFYHQLYIISNNYQNEFLNIQDEMINCMRIKIEKMLNQLNDYTSNNTTNNQETMIIKFMEIYKNSENLLNTTKILLTNHKTRFDKDMIQLSKINNLNHKNLISEYLNSKEIGKNILENIKFYLKNLSSKEGNKFYNNEFGNLIIKFILTIGARGIFNEILEHQKEIILGNYNTESEEIFKKNSSPSEEILSNYLIDYDERIQNEWFNFKILFGENQAFLLGEKLREIMFVSKLPIILNNKQIFDNLILSQKFSILTILYKLLNRKIDSLILFQDKFFQFYIDRFYSDMKIPQNLKEGLQYIDFLLERIKILNAIFSDCFAKDRRIQLRYKETLSRMINNKNVKNMYMLCGVYLNEIMSRSSGDFKNLEQALTSLSQILYSIDDVDNFFLTVQKFMIKRVSNLKFNPEHEKYMIKVLRDVYGARYCFAIYRILDDIENSEKFFKPKDENRINIFSFNAINRNDLVIVFNKFSPELEDVTSNIIKSYQLQYPHRIINFSQNLSTCIVKFKSGSSSDNRQSPIFYELLVNFIQASILMRCKNTSVNNSIKIEDIISTFEVKNIPLLRTNLMALIQAGILILKNRKDISDILNSDELIPNPNFKPPGVIGNKIPNLINLTNVNELSTQFLKTKGKETDKDNELTLSRSHTSQSDINSLENSMESQSAIYNSNKIYILDSRIIKMVKACVGGNLEHNSLVKALLIESKKLFGEGNMPDLSMIQKRIDCLIERNLITRKIEEGKILYNYI